MIISQYEKKRRERSKKKKEAEGMLENRDKAHQHICSRSDGRSPENGTRLDASGYEGDFTRKSESNGDKLGEMRNVTAVIGPKYDSSYVPFREEQMSTIEKALVRFHFFQQKFVIYLSR